jgi:peroxiredoxin
VHFADGKQPPLPAVGEALHRSRHRDAGIPVIVVLPTGSLVQRRSVVEERLGSLGHKLELPLVITENYEGSWTQAFSASGDVTTCLMGPEGEITWKEQGPLDPKRLAKALDEHATAGSRRRSRRPPIALRVGERIPDLLYKFAKEHELQGRRVLLLFCKSWSTPCIKELAGLEQMHERAGAKAAVILAIADGEETGVTEELVRQYHLRFPVMADPCRQLGRAFAINCWPTIVSIRDDGLINKIHYGATHRRRRRVPAGSVANV